ncbi:MAG: glycerophosphodiester phosphodiesterase [Chitinophagales bacterium]|nr:glycerophosphodiester phosphodiesterase [Bacteroidota bacterium]MCB9256372.1 glycerophosphodiester phosphodiesterase [Chitinophagales bacterium]
MIALLPNKLNAQTKIIAHRGFSSEAPENSLSAFQLAIESGAEYFELDVQKSLDGVIVVSHDDKLKRCSSTDSKLSIKEEEWSRLKEEKVGYPEKFQDRFLTEKLPTLEEALLLAKGKIKVCVEIKVHNAEEEILEIIRKTGMQKEVIIFSFHYDVLEKIRAKDASIPLLYLMVMSSNKNLRQATKINASAIGVGSLTKVNSKFVSKVHKAGLELWKWTVNEKEEMQELIDLSIDGIITNYPNWALELRKP